MSLEGTLKFLGLHCRNRDISRWVDDILNGSEPVVHFDAIKATVLS